MAKSGIVDIDIYKSTILKKGKSQNKVRQVFNAYHSLVEETFKKFNAENWHQMGDGGIFLFPTSIDAVDACIRLLENLSAFNEKEKNVLSFPLFVRIGIHEIERRNIENVSEGKRGKFAHPALDIAGKLQKNCPIGRISISMEVYKKLGVRQHIFRPILTDFAEVGFFVLADHLFTPQEEKLLTGLSERQKRLIPPIPFLTWDKIMPDEKINLTAANKILEQPLLVVLGETSSARNGPISSAATSDAIGMMEVMATLRAHLAVRVAIDQWEDTADVASNRNIVIIGSGMVNIYAFVLNDIFRPVHFVKIEGRVLDQIIGTSNEGEVYFGPHAPLLNNSNLKDSGLVIISKNPFNSDKTLLWVAGITGMATQAVASFLRDLVIDAGSTLREIGAPDSARPIACVIEAKERKSEKIWRISNYYRRWRILDYRVLWMVDRKGDKIL